MEPKPKEVPGHQGVPAGEDDDGQADEAAARGDGLRKGAHGAKGQGRSGDANQEAAEHIGRQAEAVDLDAGGLGRLGILPHGGELQAQLGLSQDPEDHRRQDHGEIGQDILIEENFTEDGDAGQARNGDGLERLNGDVGIGGAEDHAVEEVGKAHGQNVEHDADDGLVLAEPHGPHRHDQTAEHPGGGPGQNADPEAAGTQRHQVGEECAEKHLAFQGNAHDASPLGHGVTHGAVDQGDALPHAEANSARQERGGQDRIHFSPPSFVCSGRR